MLLRSPVDEGPSVCGGVRKRHVAHALDGCALTSLLHGERAPALEGVLRIALPAPPEHQPAPARRKRQRRVRGQSEQA